MGVGFQHTCLVGDTSIQSIAPVSSLPSTGQGQVGLWCEGEKKTDLSYLTAGSCPGHQPLCALFLLFAGIPPSKPEGEVASQ